MTTDSSHRSPATDFDIVPKLGPGSNGDQIDGFQSSPWQTACPPIEDDGGDRQRERCADRAVGDALTYTAGFGSPDGLLKSIYVSKVRCSCVAHGVRTITQ